MALRLGAVERGTDPSVLRDEGDRRSHDLIVRLLAESHPDDAVLSEEGVDGTERLHARRVWIVDPLDGTREYGDPARDDWAVHVALIADGELDASAVALPAQDLTFSTAEPPPHPPPHAGPPRLVVSESRPPPVAAVVGDALGVATVSMGSAGAKAMAIVRGQADIYLHAGGQYEWDNAAPAGVAAAAGLHTSRLDGSPLRYNNPDPWLPDLLICRPELAAAVLAAANG